MSDDTSGGYRNLSGRLTSRQMRFLAAFLLTGNVSKAARRVPVSRSQVYRWLEDATVQSVFRSVTQSHYEMARNMLAAGTVNAATKVLETIEEGDGKLAVVLLERMGVFPKTEMSFGTMDPEFLQHLQEFAKESEEEEKAQVLHLMGRVDDDSDTESGEAEGQENEQAKDEGEGNEDHSHPEGAA